MDLTRLIYSSTRRQGDIEILDAILRTSRANNHRDNITGVLVSSDQYFLQLLEGGRAAVGQCFMRIMQDPRHHEIQIISTTEARHRLFSEWSMQRVATTGIKREVLDRYTTNGVFVPTQLPQSAIEDMCRTLTGDGWQMAA